MIYQKVEAGKYKFTNDKGYSGEVYKCYETGMWFVWVDQGCMIVNEGHSMREMKTFAESYGG